MSTSRKMDILFCKVNNYLEPILKAGECEQLVLSVDLPTRGSRGVVSLSSAIQTRTD